MKLIGSSAALQLRQKCKETNRNRETGWGRKTCMFYEELGRILGHRPASLLSLFDTGNSFCILVDSQESEKEIDGKIIITIFH